MCVGDRGALACRYLDENGQRGNKVPHGVKQEHTGGESGLHFHLLSPLEGSVVNALYPDVLYSVFISTRG